MAQHQLRASPQTVRIGVFDAIFPPVMTIESGDTVVVQCVSGRQDVMPPASAGLRCRRNSARSSQPIRRCGPGISSPARSPSPAPSPATCWRSASRRSSRAPTGATI